MQQLQCQSQSRKLRRITACIHESDADEITRRMVILSESDKTGKGRMPSVGYLGGIRIPEMQQKSAETAGFSVSVATVVSFLALLRRLNMPLEFCYTPRGLNGSKFLLYTTDSMSFECLAIF
jgi:hypothetical protein